MSRSETSAAMELTDAERSVLDSINAELRQVNRCLNDLAGQRADVLSGLHAEGWTIRALARLIGVSPQRMSAILEPAERRAQRSTRTRERKEYGEKLIAYAEKVKAEREAQPILAVPGSVGPHR